MVRPSRRDFLAGLALSPLWVSSCRSAGTPEPHTTGLLDIHIHLFGTGDDGSGCKVSTTIRRSLAFTYLTWTLGIRGEESLDAAYVRVLARTLRDSELSQGVIVGQDAVYDQSGIRDEDRTHFYTPNDYVFHVCGNHADLMVPCVSINPNRRDSIEELDRCHSMGAPILKIHPPTQGVDLLDESHRLFFRRCAELDMVVMVHTGHEHSTPVIDISLADPLRLELALEEGCRVVACHSGSGLPADQPDYLPHFMEMVHRHENLWGDTSILGSLGRRRDLQRLVADSDVRSRLLHGSDYPFPAWPLEFTPELGRDVAYSLQMERNPLTKDLRLKTALGLGASATRAFELLRGNRYGPID